MLDPATTGIIVGIVTLGDLDADAVGAQVVRAAASLGHELRAVGLGAHHGAGAKGAANAGLVFHHDGGALGFLHLISDEAHRGVTAPARCKGDNDRDRTGRVLVLPHRRLGQGQRTE